MDDLSLFNQPADRFFVYQPIKKFSCANIVDLMYNILPLPPFYFYIMSIERQKYCATFIADFIYNILLSLPPFY